MCHSECDRDTGDCRYPEAMLGPEIVHEPARGKRARIGAIDGASPPAAFAVGYDFVFAVAAGLSIVIAIVSMLLPRHSRV